MRTIFDKTMLNRLKLNNRIFRSATWEASADTNGNLTESLYDVYRELAEGGVGAIITGITTVSPHDAKLNGIVQFHSDAFVNEHRKLTDIVHEHECKIFMQTAMVDSVFYVDDDLYEIPIDKLTAENIAEVITLFRDAAVRAKTAGYDGIQIHAAHFFFLSKFISPLFNSRADEYGGDSERRAKILADILDAVREVVGKDFCVIAKINGDDFSEGGLTLEDCIVACKIMKSHGVDAIEISGNYTSREARAHRNEGYFKDYAVAVKKVVDVPVILVGGHRSLDAMNLLLNTTNIEYLSMSRALIREPALINRWAGGDVRPSACIGCNACYNTPAHKCIFNLRRMS